MKKVLIVIITKDKVEKGCLKAIDNQDYPKECTDRLIHVQEPHFKYDGEDEFKKGEAKYINCSANREASRIEALKREAEFFWYVDSDMAPPPHALSNLMLQADQKDRPKINLIVPGFIESVNQRGVVAGWYPLVNDSLKRWAAGKWIDHNLMYLLRSPKPGLTRVDMAGLGCALFTREALSSISFEHGTDVWAKAVMEPLPGDGPYAIHFNLQLGECGILGNRLAEKGFEMMMDGSVICEHLIREE